LVDSRREADDEVGVPAVLKGRAPPGLARCRGGPGRAGLAIQRRPNRVRRHAPGL